MKTQHVAHVMFANCDIMDSNGYFAVADTELELYAKVVQILRTYGAEPHIAEELDAEGITENPMQWCDEYHHRSENSYLYFGDVSA